MRLKLPSIAFLLGMGSSLALATSAQAQTPWIDAGQQAMIMHQGDLLEQQTAPNNQENRKIAKPPERTTACSMASARARLRPEYERRAKLYGRQNADNWLRKEASALGAKARAGQRC